MPRRTDSQSGRAETPDYAAVTLEDELDAAWMAAELWEDQIEKDASPLDPWYSALCRLADIQARKQAGTLSPIAAHTRAYRVLHPLVGRAGTRQILYAATSDFEPVAISIRHRTTKEQAAAMAALHLQHHRSHGTQAHISPHGIALEILKRRDWEQDARRYGAIIHRRMFDRAFEGGVTAAIEELDLEPGMPSETRLWKYWTFYRDDCFDRGYADARLPMLAHNEANLPNDLLRIADFSR